MGTGDVAGLSAEELDLVDRTVTRLFPEVTRHLTLRTLLDDWRSIVEEVEAGYSGNVDDYAYDLTRRDRLGRLLRAVPEAIQRKISLILEPIDARFIAATRPDPLDVLGKFYGHGNQWWWARLPKVIQGPLAESLRPHVQ